MHDLNSLQNIPWLMEQSRLQAIAARLAREKEWPTAAKLAKLQKKAAAGAMRKVSGKIAVLSIQGVIEQRMSAISYFMGGFSTEYGCDVLSSLVDAKEVSAIVLDIDSPGGTSYGVEEFSDAIYQARAKKPIYAIANSMMASAAYWIGSAATQVCATPGGDVGSIGVYAMHIDWSKAVEEAGVKITIAKAGKYKAEFSEFQPLSKEAEDYLQGLVDDTYSRFVKAVARNRGSSVGTVRGESYGQGRVLCSDDALKAGMCDQVITFPAMIQKLGGNAAFDPKYGSRASAEVLELRAKHAEAKAHSPTVPAIKAGADLSHDSQTAASEPTWSDVDKTKLPRVAFAEQGTADEKSSWGFPHHFVKGGSLDDDSGVYKSGYLYLHQEGLNAAWSAAQGGRSGEKADEKVIAHLEQHRKALGLDKKD